MNIEPLWTEFSEKEQYGAAALRDYAHLKFTEKTRNVNSILELVTVLHFKYGDWYLNNNYDLSSLYENLSKEYKDKAQTYIEEYGTQDDLARLDGVLIIDGKEYEL